MLIPKVGKLIAYRPQLSDNTLFGYFVSGNEKEWLINIEGQMKKCDPKLCTLVWNKKQDGFREV